MTGKLTPARDDVPTYRSVSAEHTWERIAPVLPAVGVTRIADVTGLDELGIPVHLAVRPAAATLSVSQGKGVTPIDSKVSAAMEAIETWHAENLRLSPDAVGPARSVLDTYDVNDLDTVGGSLVTDTMELAWVMGTGLLTRAACPVPLAAVGLDARARLTWDMALFHTHSSGLASGNTATEAVLHGLLELVERDCTCELGDVPAAARTYVDPRADAPRPVHAVLDGFDRAGCWLEVVDATNHLNVPCYVAYTWASDLPVMFAGSGCHPDATVALLRALTEAAQSRLTFISGTRDDFTETMYAGSRDFGTADPGGYPATSVVPRRDDRSGDLDLVLADTVRTVAAHTGVEPFAVDLSRPELGLPVHRTFAPGLRFSGRHEVNRA